MTAYQQLSQAAFKRRQMDFARTVAVLSGLFGLILALLVSQGEEMVPLVPTEGTRGYAVSTAIIVLTFLLGLIIPAFGYRRLADYDPSLSEAERRAERMGGRLIFRIVIALGMGILLGLVSIVTFLLLANAFEGASFTRFSVLLFAAGYGALLGFVLAWLSVRFTAGAALVLGVVVLVLGVLSAILLASNPQWWQRSISYLGHDQTAETVFGIFLTLGGLILLTVILDMTRTLKVLVDAEQFKLSDYHLLSRTLPILAIAITMVGLFPTTVNPLSDFLHNLAANGMAVLFVILQIIIPLRIHIYSKTFRNVSWAFAAFNISLFVLHFGFHAINFVTLELLLLPACGAWLIYLRYNTLAYARTKSAIVFSTPLEANPLHDPLVRALDAYSARGATDATRQVLVTHDGRLFAVLELVKSGVSDRLVAQLEDERIVVLLDDPSDPLGARLQGLGVPVDRITVPAGAS